MFHIIAKIRQLFQIKILSYQLSILHSLFCFYLQKKGQENERNNQNMPDFSLLGSGVYILQNTMARGGGMVQGKK